MNIWPNTQAAALLHVTYPIVQAGMAGGPTTPELVAAVSNAGGLGSLGAGYMSAEQIRDAVRHVRGLTDQPFAVNLFVPEPDRENQAALDTGEMADFLRPVRMELGLESGDATPPRTPVSFEEQLAVVIEERVPVFSFTFGIPLESMLSDLRRRGIVVVGTATTVAEAELLETAGVDLIVAQGSEAGGHRGTFAADFAQALVGTLALVPQVVDRVHVPVIAAGGVMDGRGIAACLALGAQGVQMGSAFLPCAESGAHALHKEAVLNARDDATVVTDAFSGKPARGIRNAFIDVVATYAGEVPPYPMQNALTRPIRTAAGQQNRSDYMSLWAGQAAGLATRASAAELVERLVSQTNDILRNMGGVGQRG